MKILLMGNHSCSNRGDAAISRGLIDYLEQNLPDAIISCVSRHPLSASFFLGRPYRGDGIFNYYNQPRKGLWGRLLNYVIHRSLSLTLALKVNYPAVNRLIPLPAQLKSEIAYISGFDVVIQVGGSNLVDLYGTSQFDYGLCSILAKRPPFLIGHSVGPFRSGLSRFLAKTLLENCAAVGLREQESRAILSGCDINTTNVTITPDTAWLVSCPVQPVVKNSKLIALTLRTLQPFESRIGMTDNDYLQHMARLCDKLTSDGYIVQLFSTCTSFDHYKNDDRLMAIRLKNQCSNKAAVVIEMAELSDIELIRRFAECTLTIATRLHSGILSMLSGTPALLLNYEHKSAGVADLMELADLALPFSVLADNTMYETVITHLNNITALEGRVAEAVRSQKQELHNSLPALLNQFGIINEN